MGPEERNRGVESIIARIKAILMTPKTEWPIVARETARTGDVFTSYVMPLAAIGPEAETAVPPLIQSLKSKNPDMRVAAAYALSNLGYQSPAALPALKAALRDRDQRVREEVTQSVRKLESAARFRNAPTSSAQPKK